MEGVASWGRGFLPRGEELGRDSARQPPEQPRAGVLRPRAGPAGKGADRGGWSGAGSRLLQQQGAVGLGALAQLPVSWVSELPTPHSRTLGASARVSQDPLVRLLPA